MELVNVKDSPRVGEIIEDVVAEIVVTPPQASPFIEANTVGSNLYELQHKHIIPVFIKDNEPVISHAEFITTTLELVQELFNGQEVLPPAIRLSHPIKGRIPDARNKPASELLEHEKTLYYERMAFIIEVPSVSCTVNGNKLNLCIGGVKAYNLDNLYSRSGADQHFKVFIGFQNKVCTNLCISTDGLQNSLKVKSVEMLGKAISQMLKDFSPVRELEQLQAFGEYHLTDTQFAQLIGRCRMYKYLADHQKRSIPPLMFGESQINAVCHDYYRDKAFCSDGNSISLWQLYNLFTGANKSTYIDSFLDRGQNAFTMVRELQLSLQNDSDCWYLN